MGRTRHPGNAHEDAPTRANLQVAEDFCTALNRVFPECYELGLVLAWGCGYPTHDKSRSTKR